MLSKNKNKIGPRKTLSVYVPTFILHDIAFVCFCLVSFVILVVCNNKFLNFLHVK